MFGFCAPYCPNKLWYGFRGGVSILNFGAKKRKAPYSEAFAICEPCSTGRSVFIVYATEHVGLSIVGRASCFCERTLFVCGAVIKLVPQTEEHVVRFARAEIEVKRKRTVTN